MINAAQPVVKALQKQAPVIGKYALKIAVSTAQTAAGFAATLVAIDCGWNISKRIKNSQLYKRVITPKKESISSSDKAIETAVAQLNADIAELEKSMTTASAPSEEATVTEQQENRAETNLSRISEQLSALFNVTKTFKKS